MDGKTKCRILKQIRAAIAANNDIDLVIEECPHKGDCLGTCPRCEEEVRFLEQELEKRREENKAVALEGTLEDFLRKIAAEREKTAADAPGSSRSLQVMGVDRREGPDRDKFIASHVYPKTEDRTQRGGNRRPDDGRRKRSMPPDLEERDDEDPVEIPDWALSLAGIAPPLSPTDGEGEESPEPEDWNAPDPDIDDAVGFMQLRDWDDDL